MDINLLITLAAIIIAFIAYKLQQLNNFVDNRKAVLREYCYKKDTDSPSFLTLIQNIGKDSRITCIFREILQMRDPAYANIVDEIKEIRFKYNKLLRMGYIVMVIILFLFVYNYTLLCSRCLLQNLFLGIIGVFLAIIGFRIFLAARLPKMNYTKATVLNFELERIVAKAYAETFKDRSAILKREEISGGVFTRRYEGVIRAVDEVVKKLKESGKGINSIKILDVGCGDGQIENMLAKNVTIKGIDVSSKSIKAAKANDKRNFPKGSKHKFDVIDFWSYDKGKGCFDLVIAVELLEHLVETERGLKKLIGFIRNGGYIVATVPNAQSKYNQDIASKTKMDIENSWLRFFSRKKIIYHFWKDEDTKGNYPHRLFEKKEVERMIGNLPELFLLKCELIKSLNKDYLNKDLDTFLFIAERQSKSKC